MIENTQSLEKGGFSVTMKGIKAIITMCDLKDWFAKKKIRIHIPKNLLQGSARVVMRNFNAENQSWEIIDAIEEAGVKVLDLYMIRNKTTQYFTGMIKVTLLGNRTMNTWLETGKANLCGVRRPIERERKALKCNNCYHYNHKMEDCKFGKQCRKCGSTEHVAAECKTDKQQLTTNCGYCREEGHTSKECTTRREDEKNERINYRKTQRLQIKTVWQERARYTEKISKPNTEISTQSEPNLTTNDDTTTNVSSISETAKMVDNLRTEMKEILEENQKIWQKEMLNEIRENKMTEEETNMEVELTPLNNNIITELKEEFKEMITINNNEWKARLEQ